MDIFELLDKMTAHEASDLYLTLDLPPSWRGMNIINGETPLNKSDIIELLNQITTEEERKKLSIDKELNIAITDKHQARYRVNLFYQRQNLGMVIRKVKEKIPTIEELNLNKTYLEAIMESRGLILVVGTAGSGKSTSIASMLDYRNTYGTGHIITVEDPIEYVHKHKKCIITQREIGLDTHSWDDALKNALRQRPDIIFIGEIRDAETMAHAINFAETGHLCIATLHATSAAQSIERVSNFFPMDFKNSNLLAHVIRDRLAHVLRFIFAQRLVTPITGDYKIPAVEVLRNEGLMKQLIIEGKIPEITDLLGRNSDIGMMNFEMCLLDLLKKGLITEETAIAECDNADNMRLNIMKNQVIISQPKQKYGEDGF
jgi:twitching motility protein PilU